MKNLIIAFLVSLLLWDKVFIIHPIVVFPVLVFLIFCILIEIDDTIADYKRRLQRGKRLASKINRIWR